MTRVPTIRQAAVARVLKALKAEGFDAAQIVMRPTGEVVITAGAGIGPPAAQPLSATPTPSKPDNLDDWRARKADRERRAAQGR